MRTSEQINEVAAALAKAQAVIKGAVKDSVNPHFRNRYADLASVWDACRGPITAHGLSVVQTLGTDAAGVRITTMLLHSSGQWIADDLIMPAGNTPQTAGSAITYGRRYALAAIVGVAPEDDDAEAAEGRNQTARPAAKPVTTKPEGYDQWLLDMEAAADMGTDALRQAWLKSPETHRTHLGSNDGLKARAKKADAKRETVTA